MSNFAKKLSLVAASLCLSASALAIQGSKFSATLSKTALMNETTNGSATIMSSQIHTSNKKELLIGVSLESGLYTQTQVKGRNGDKDSSSAQAKVEISVYVDGKLAAPGKVIYNERTQELSAVLGGVIESCTFNTDSNGDGIIDDNITIIIENNCIVTDEEIELIQRTMSANHFNFVMPDLPSGDHTITVKAEIVTDSSSSNGSASATGLVGKGSLTVETVRAINQSGGLVILE